MRHLPRHGMVGRLTIGRVAGNCHPTLTLDPTMPTTTLTLLPAQVCRLPRTYAMAALPMPAHRVAVSRANARTARASAPMWTIVDCHSDGARAYRNDAHSIVPAFTPWQAACLDAIRMMRRWHAYSDGALEPAQPNMPLDGCNCRVCLSRMAHHLERASAPTR